MSLALVLGGGASVWDDVERAFAIADFDYVAACNDAGASWPGRLDLWVTLHPENMMGWRDRRAKRGLTPAERIVFHKTWESRVRGGNYINPSLVMDHKFPGQTQSGSSGHFVTKAALELLPVNGAVLCGIPMTADDKHYFDESPWSGAHRHQAGWLESMDHLQGRVKSMSGQTMKWLGEPTLEWVAKTMDAGTGGQT